MFCFSFLLLALNGVSVRHLIPPSAGRACPPASFLSQNMTFSHLLLGRVMHFFDSLAIHKERKQKQKADCELRAIGRKVEFMLCPLKEQPRKKEK